jgi:hypothetical protein
MMLLALDFACSFALTFGLNAPYTDSHGVIQEPLRRSMFRFAEVASHAFALKKGTTRSAVFHQVNKATHLDL